MYYNDRWKTRDHVIPYKMFWMMLNAAGHVEAREQLQQALAVAHGTAISQSGKQGKVKAHTRRLMRAANPERL